MQNRPDPAVLAWLEQGLERLLVELVQGRIGIAQACQATLATRHQGPFQDRGLPVLNPFHG